MQLTRITCDPSPCPPEVAAQMEQWTMWLTVTTVAAVVLFQMYQLYCEAQKDGMRM